MTTTAKCTCTTFGHCAVCRPPCAWIVDSLGEIPVRCGDQSATFLSADLPVCIDHFQFSKLHAGIW